MREGLRFIIIVIVYHIVLQGQPGGKPNKGNGKPDDAAPVLPQSKAKAHAKVKAKPKKAARSESTDSKPDKSKKHIRCKFHFTDAGCRNGQSFQEDS